MMSAVNSILLMHLSRSHKQILYSVTGNWLQRVKANKTDILVRNFNPNRCSAKTLSQLNSRSILRLAGPDTLPFLQGLVTNDVLQLNKPGILSLYSMMLNVQGRVLYDMFFYNISQDAENKTFLMDVDSSVKDDVLKILKRYKLRKKVDISDKSDEFQVWSKFKISKDLNVSPSKKPPPEDVLVVTLDPRVPSFGKRVIRRGHDEEWIRNSVDESVYRQMRYQWGIPEGPVDLPPGNCFPLESNLVFMNGVDFHKGCYIGQELTARTYHTGVTRKRLMPLDLHNPPPAIEKDSIIVNEKGRNVGKLRAHEEGHGIGLVRLAHINDNLSIKCNNSSVQVKTQKPAWWPPLDNER